MRTLHQLMDLSHRTALVTGGAGHIGASIAVCLAELGAKVAIVDRDAAACELGLQFVERSLCRFVFLRHEQHIRRQGDGVGVVHLLDGVANPLHLAVQRLGDARF